MTTNKNIYDGLSEDELERLSADISQVLSGVEPESINIQPEPKLLGIPDRVYRQINAVLNSGKRHIIFYGPPGTGKTSLAEYISLQLSPDDGYEMVTASSSWTSQDLVGGYQPLGGGAIGFIPGILVRNLHRPFIIDEMNRCDIDKVIGPLFSVLNGQESTLPYRTDVSDKDSDFYTLMGKGNPETVANHQFCPSTNWRILATLNTIDKSQLGQISYALSRRFAWIRVGIPEDCDDFVVQFLKSVPTGSNPISNIWKAVSSVREIGAAPFIDLIKSARLMEPAIDFLAPPTPDTAEIILDCFYLYLLPMLDGIYLREADQLTAGIIAALGLNPNDALAEELKARLLESAA